MNVVIPMIRRASPPEKEILDAQIRIKKRNEVTILPDPDADILVTACLTCATSLIAEGKCLRAPTVPVERAPFSAL